MSNSMELKFKASISNELLARQALIAFISPLNPTVEEIGESIKNAGESASALQKYIVDEDIESWLSY